MDTNQKRPDVMDTLTDSQLSELELRVDDKNQEEFRTIAANYGWDEATVRDVWNWLAVSKGYEGFEE